MNKKKMLLFFALVIVLLVLFFYPQTKKFFLVDACLDRSGRWNYEKIFVNINNRVTFYRQRYPDYKSCYYLSACINSRLRLPLLFERAVKKLPPLRGKAGMGGINDLQS